MSDLSLDITKIASEPKTDFNDRVVPVKQLNIELRPREKGIKYGIQSLTTPELWAIILRTGSQGCPITDLCNNLMNWVNGSLKDLERIQRETLLHVKGLGDVKAQQVEAVMELARRYFDECNKPDSKKRISSSSDIYHEMRTCIGNLAHEEIWVIYLNRANRIISKERITSGSAVASIFDLKSIIRNALLHHAQAIILCHNHPSGNKFPSQSDDNITKMLRDASKTMELTMFDHVIVTSDGYYSYNDNGRL